MQGEFLQGTSPFPFYEEKCKSVECWDGIGGRMVLARQRQAAGKPRKTGAKQKAGSRGTSKMSAAANKTLEENSEEIAKSLLKSTLGGNVNSAKLLFSLADGQKEYKDEVVRQCLRSRADKLAAEPEWPAELMETGSEMDFGAREPEN